MILFQELINRGIIEEGQVSDIIKIADEKHDGSIDQALLDFNLNEDKILEAKGFAFNIIIYSIIGLITALIIRRERPQSI